MPMSGYLFHKGTDKPQTFLIGASRVAKSAGAAYWRPSRLSGSAGGCGPARSVTSWTSESTDETATADNPAEADSCTSASSVLL